MQRRNNVINFSFQNKFHKKKHKITKIFIQNSDNEEEEVDSRVQIGIFKEIDCIWKTVNQSLELTTFDPKTGQILRNKIYWEEFGSDIESVALASPVPNVFVEEVNYILVVATAVEIRILAVIFNPFETIHIEPSSFLFFSSC